jgi:hypothetical protein
MTPSLEYESREMVSEVILTRLLGGGKRRRLRERFLRVSAVTVLGNVSEERSGSKSAEIGVATFRGS